uniref:Uncharacterized protein n=1 Tax=Aegilops tauschii subsp. strangulata TaxID=200361 RepID=A0A453BI72_AEGTS
MDACLCPAASAPMPATAPSRHDQRQQSPRRLTVCRCAPWPWGLETCIVEGQQLGAEQPYKAEGKIEVDQIANFYLVQYMFLDC